MGAVSSSLYCAAGGSGTNPVATAYQYYTYANMNALNEVCPVGCRFPLTRRSCVLRNCSTCSHSRAGHRALRPL